MAGGFGVLLVDLLFNKPDNFRYGEIDVIIAKIILKPVIQGPISELSHENVPMVEIWVDLSLRDF